MTDNLSNNIPTPFTPSGTPSVLPDSPPPQEVAVDPIPPLPSKSPSAANPPTTLGVPEPKIETVVKPDPPLATPVPEEDPAIRPPGTLSAVGGKSSDPYVKKHQDLPKIVIAGVVALVFLVVALGSGLYLTRQNQDLKTNASYCAICSGSGCECANGTQTGNSCQYAPPECSELGRTWQPDSSCTVGSSCGGGGGGGGGGTCPPPDTNTGACAIYRCYGGCSGGICNENRGDIGCDQAIGSQCGQIDEECRRPDNSTYWRLKDGQLNCGGSCSGSPTLPPEPTATPRPTSTPQPTATPTPRPPTVTPTSIPPSATPTPETISANCDSLVPQMSDGAGGWITKTDVEFASQARPGDGVRFVCTGAKTGGTFTKSAFFINGVLHTDDGVKLNDTQFAVEYTIPAAGELEVESVLLHDTKGWVD